MSKPGSCIGGGSRAAVLCSSPGAEMVYQFYRLPAGSRGGGPELHLDFGHDDRCNSADWLNTQ